MYNLMADVSLKHWKIDGTFYLGKTILVGLNAGFFLLNLFILVVCPQLFQTYYGLVYATFGAKNDVFESGWSMSMNDGYNFGVEGALLRIKGILGDGY